MNRVLYWLSELFSQRNYTLRNFTVFLLVLFCIQYIPVEGHEVSWVKVAVMAVTPFIYLRYMVVNKALFIALAYFLWIFITAYALHPETFRASTVIYHFMFFVTFVAFYTFVWNYHVFTLPFFIKVLRGFIFVMVGVLVAQQLCLLAGFKVVPILNMTQVLNRGIGANSLTFEPSTLGRLISVLFYAYMKCCEYRRGRMVNITEVLDSEHRWVTVSYVWAVMTMGSGTAFLAFAIVSLYFLRGWYVIFSAPLFVLAYFVMDYYGNESFSRAVNATEATLTLDSQTVMDTDGSAAMRIKPMLNTLKIDLSDPDTWLGHGCDYSVRYGLYADTRYIGNIGDYGLIAFVLSCIFTYSCSVYFLSIQTIMITCGVAGYAVGNISYVWGILMIFTCVNYFRRNGYGFQRDDEQQS